MARMSDMELVMWMTNFIEVVGAAPADYGLTAAQVTEVVNFRDGLQAAITKREGSEGVFRADVAAQQGSRNIADPFISFLIASIKKNPNVSPEKKINARIEPNKPATSTPPVTPAAIMANGYENGINVVRWDRSGNKPNTQFILEYREAAETSFEYLATTTETVFNHIGMKPGMQCAYRVKAQRAGQESPYSNVAVVYMA